MSENECNGLTTAKYLVVEADVVEDPRRDAANDASPDEAAGRPRHLSSTTLFSIAFLLAVGLGIGYQTCLPVLLEKTSTVWGDVTKPLASLRDKNSFQNALNKRLAKNQADIAEEFQRRNKDNPVNPHLEKLTREGWTQPDWMNKASFQATPFGS